MTATFSIVIPTIGRPSLAATLGALDDGVGPMPAEVVVVDDRPDPRDDLPLPVSRLPVQVVAAGGRGPAAARNVGWRTTTAPWVAFLDDDVVPSLQWRQDLGLDLDRVGTAAASQGRVRVPLRRDRRPTDWERRTAGLADARWITADLAYKRSVLQQIGGFDERFPRAFREDADLALRLMAHGHHLVQGERTVEHPVPPQPRFASLRAQRGNSDDALMNRLHGRGWHDVAGAQRGRIRRHVAITIAGGTTLLAALAGRRRLAKSAAALWALGTGEFAAQRIYRGPLTPSEVVDMLCTSALIPPLATFYRATGELAHRTARPWRGLPDAVLFDRDGTLVHDVPYNGDPEMVTPVPLARESLDRLRAAGVALGIVTNQSGVSAGRISRSQMSAVNERIVQLLGPFGTVQVCEHGPDDGCACRKPKAGLVLAACAALKVDPARTVLIGDVGSDMRAAAAAGSRGILVPTPETRHEEVAAYAGASDLPSAVGRVLAGAW